MKRSAIKMRTGPVLRWFHAMLPALAAVAVATVHYCNTDMMIDCAPLGATCSAPSPNCPGYGNYNGTVVYPGSRLLVKLASTGWYDTETLPRCVYYCAIGPDCVGQYVSVARLGGYQATCDYGTPCP